MLSLPLFVAGRQGNSRPTAPPPSSGGAYSVSDRLAAFIARHKAVRVALGASNTSSFEGTTTLPTAPTISSFQTAATLAEFNLRKANNTEIRLTSGFTGKIDLNGLSDVRVVWQSGVQTVAPADDYGVAVNNTSRVELVGEGSGQHVVGAIFGFTNYSDLKVLNLDARTRNNSTFTFTDMHDFSGGTRVALVGCYLYARSYVISCFNVNSLIVANSDVQSTALANHAAMRGGGGANGGSVLVMDSRFNIPGDTAIRPQAENPRWGVWNVQIDGGTGVSVLHATSATLQTGDLVVIDLYYYGDGDSLKANYEEDVPPVTVLTGMLTAENVNQYSSWDSPASQVNTGTLGPGFLIGNNPTHAPTTPPAWSRQ